MVDWLQFGAFLIVDVFIVITVYWRIKVYSKSERTDTAQATWQEFFIVGVPAACLIAVYVALVLQTMKLLHYALA